MTINEDGMVNPNSVVAINYYENGPQGSWCPTHRDLRLRGC